MAGKITALLMAVLIAVPFCCCEAKAAPEAPASKALSCCHASAPGAPAGAPEDAPPCDCGEEFRDQWLSGGEVTPAPPQWTLLSEPSWERLSAVVTLGGRPACGAVESPLASGPAGKALLAVHCRRRL